MSDAPTTTAPARRRWISAALVALALLGYWLMAVSVSPRMGVTADEVVHLTGGYSYWKFNDYRLHPENGTLPMRVAALPLLGMDLKFPPLDDPDWVKSKVNLVGEKFYYQLGNPVPEMLQRGRAAIALFGVLTCWLVWRWARGLFGPAAGGLALALAVFCPALLAHGGLITSDIAFTACALAALTAVWRLLHRITWGWLLLAGIACGACFLSKMSGAIIVPLIGALWLLRCLRGAPLAVALGGRVRLLRRRVGVAAASLAALVAVAAGSLFLLWANYSFRFEAFNRELSQAEGYYFSWDVLLEREQIPWPDDGSLLSQFAPKLRPLQQTTLTRLVGALRDARVLPEPYLWGFAHTYKFSRERPAFFMGEYRKTGWPLFFPVAFLMKTPPATLLAFLAGVGALGWLALGRRPAARPGRGWLRVTRSPLYKAAPLILFFIVYWIMAVRMTLNLGHRHILPVYPAFYVFTAAAVVWCATRAGRTVALALGLVVLLQAADSWRARPFYLSYFQPLTGGTENAYHYFVESSLDWGQGLPDFEKWLAELRASGNREPVVLTYFGADSPRARKIDAIRFGDEMNDSGERVFPAQVRGGWFAISATYYQCTFLPVRGTWGEPQEKVYRQALADLSAAGPKLAGMPPDERRKLMQLAMDLEFLQFARLSRWLHVQQRRPLKLIGGSILLFHLTDQEVAEALYGPLPYNDPTDRR